MITRNYIRAWVEMFTNYADAYRTPSITNVFVNTFIRRRQYDGELRTNTYIGDPHIASQSFTVMCNARGENPHYADNSYMVLATGGLLTFGEGTQPPTTDDYELSQPIDITQLVQLYGTKGPCQLYSSGAFKGRAYWDGSMTCINVSGRTLHIREVGFWSMSGWGLYNSSNTYLIGRFIIPERVVAPGDCFVFNYRVMY